MKPYVLFWFFVAAIASALPIPFMKKYTETKALIWIVLSVVCYIFLIYAYSVVLDHESIAVVYPLLRVLTLLFVVVAGIFAFSVKLDMRTILGIVLGIASIFLLSQHLKK